jgi:hypothetical protein
MSVGYFPRPVGRVVRSAIWCTSARNEFLRAKGLLRDIDARLWHVGRRR